MDDGASQEDTCSQLERVKLLEWCLQGWNMALKNAQLQFPERAEDIDALIKQRICGNLKVLQVPFSLLTSDPETIWIDTIMLAMCQSKLGRFI